MAAAHYSVSEQSSGGVDPSDAVDFWRHEVGGRQCWVGFEATNGHDTFRGSTKAQRYEEDSRVFQIVEFQSSAVEYERHRHQLGDDTDKRVLVPLDGAIVLAQEDRDAELLPGQIGLITMARPMGLAHADGARALILTIPGEAIPDLTDNTPLALNPDDGAIAAVMSMTTALVRTRRTSTAESFRRVFSALTDLLAGSVDPRQESDFARYARVASLARSYVERNCYDHRVTVRSIADHLNCSPRHLATALQKTSGTTPGKLLRRTRLERAAQLLRNSRSRVGVDEIAFSCGFGSTSGFREAWRAHYGVSVTEWREQVLAGHLLSPRS